MELIGRSAINPVAHVIAKGLVVATFLAPAVNRLNPNWNWFAVPGWCEWMGWILYFVGVLLVVIASIELGKNLRVGLPSGKTRLYTGGLYSWSRNPIYTAFYLVVAGVWMIAPHPVVWILSAACLIMHHRVILGEEKFLEKRFGTSWLKYRTRVRRYI